MVLKSHLLNILILPLFISKTQRLQLKHVHNIRPRMNANSPKMQNAPVTRPGKNEQRGKRLSVPRSPPPAA